MALLTVEGIYQDGKVELSERPVLVDSATRVIVTFLPSPEPFQGADPGITEDRETIRQRVLARMREGIAFGGPPYPSREELYDRNR